jgi:histidinol-phosphatase
MAVRAAGPPTRSIRHVLGLSDDLALALELADVADEITMARFRASDLVVETKPDMTPVSEADRDVEQALRDRLERQCPDDSIFGEEYGEHDSGSPLSRRWIVDPIDGTKGYVRGVPVWATLLALEDEGVLSAAVVSAPAMRRRWWATAGGGAFVREHGEGSAPRRLRVSAIDDLADAQLSYGGLEEWRTTGRLDGLLALSDRCWRTRGFGDFWQYMLVADGQAEICADPTVSLWDLAAPMLVVQEAGGRFSDFTGAATAAGGDAIASNGLLHERALTALSG